MTAANAVADPIAAHVAALERALRGPRRTRQSMVEEAGAGLRDAAAAYQRGGLAPEQAAECAVRDFGSVPEVAPQFQDELTAQQARATAVMFALVFPAMLFGWDLMWSSGLVNRRQAGGLPPIVATLAGVQDVMSAVVGVAAAVLLVTTFRRAVPPRQLTVAVGVTGFFGAVACGGTSVAMNLAGWRSTLAMLANPVTWAAFGVSMLVLVLIVWQSVRTLRVARVT